MPTVLQVAEMSIKNTSRKMEPLYVAGIMIGAPTMPEWVLGMNALILIALSGWLFYKDRK